VSVEHAGVFAPDRLGDLVMELLNLVARQKQRVLQPANLHLHAPLAHLDPRRSLVFGPVQPHLAPDDPGRNRHTLKTAF
jgi:hypothetical protein